MSGVEALAGEYGWRCGASLYMFQAATWLLDLAGRCLHASLRQIMYGEYSYLCEACSTFAHAFT
jgi:hypothetical protein